MERILDKTIVLAGCLLTAACFLVETSSGAELAASDARLLTLAIAMLIAVLCSAFTEAVSTPAGILALSAYCAAALFVPAALAFVPLALYDCARCVHRADVLRFSGALALIAIAACLMRATMPPLSTASLLCSAAAACVLSVRTSTTLARQRIAWSTRDVLASQALSLRKRNRNLRDSLDKMSAIAARNDENGATGGEAAEQKSTGETVARECARGIVASKSGGGPSREPGAGVTCGSDGDARHESVGGGVTDGTGVGGALSNGRVKRESSGSTSGGFVHSNASHEQLRPTPFACLTEREYEVARLVAEGLDNREIAATAYLSEGTVRNNISSILSKMSLKNRTQIAVTYYKSKDSTR
ncbi:response regulator transcription factor [Slackia isoflavoniconvertens]|uniref:response regulator transcription factor n=1 Tax=Slackia isoflavoniconvertens TaxID=572010 RepID=UPI003AB0F14A